MKNICLFILTIFTLSTIQAQEFNGYWEAQGFGLFAEVTDNQLDLYSYNSISLFPIVSFPLDGNQLGDDDGIIGNLYLQNDLLDLIIASTLPGLGIRFESVSKMPATTQATSDPVVNFDVFWTTFEEYCSLFEILDVDWKAQYDLYRPQINENTSDSLLFQFMGNMIQELNDGHCFLVDDENGRGIGSGQVPTSLWVDYSETFIDLLQNKYLDQGSIQGFSNNTVIAATLEKGSIGYLFVGSFEIGADSEYNDNILFDDILDDAFDYLKDTESLIIDVRNNSGGFDSNSRVLGNRLTKTTQTVFAVQDRLKDAYDSFSESLFLEISPAKAVQYIDKPVMVLTSNLSASATDVFALLSKEIDCVTTVGETTEGIFSNIIERSLPNQWRFSLSTQRYLDVNGVNHEQKGIVPDILIAEDSIALFQDDVDNILEYAIDNIASSCIMVSVKDIEENTFVKTYPNPFTDELYIDASIIENASASISIFNNFGTKVFVQQFQKGQPLNLNELPNGLYTIVIETASQTINSKIIKATN